MPLARSFSLSQKKGRTWWVEPIPDGKGVRFEVRGPHGQPREGTVSRSGATCLLCGTPVPLSYIRAEGKLGRMTAQLMAIGADGRGPRYYLNPSAEQEQAADIPPPADIPEAEMPDNPRWFSPPLYGIKTYSELFTNRQLKAIATFSDLVQEVRRLAANDAAQARLSSADARAYGIAIGTYLAFAVSKLADWSSSMCGWINTAEKARDTFARQAIPMVWDFLEIYPFSSAVGNFS